MRTTFYSLLSLLCAAGILTSSCGKSPTGPSQLPDLQPPPGVQVNDAPLPGTSQTFKWWAQISPVKGTQLAVGDQVRIRLSCSGPPGYHFFIDQGFTNGPGTPMLSELGTGGGEGDTSTCANGNGGGGRDFSVNTKTPDLQYYRFRVWTVAGEGITLGGPGYTTRLGEPTKVVDEYLGLKGP